MTPRPESSWYAVHTRSRHERKVCGELARQSFEAYLPEYRALSKRRDRRKQILRPLFPGYLFVRTPLTAEKRMSIIQTKSVVRIIGTGCKPVPIPEHQVESVRILLSTGADAAPSDVLARGRPVLVTEGPLAGVVGMVEESGKRKIIVSVELVGRAVSATLDIHAVVPYLDN